MKKHTTSFIYGILCCAISFCGVTIGHYAEAWATGYYVVFVMSAFAGLAVMLATED